MSERNFYEEVKEEVQERIKDEAEVMLKEIDKINGVTLHAVIIRPMSSNIAPTIYLDELYDEYQSGKTMEAVILTVISIYERFKEEESIDIEGILEFDRARDYIGMKLIDSSRNAQLLEEVPYVPFLDLAVVFYIVYENPRMGKGSILVKNEIFSDWGISLDELYKCAFDNFRRLSPLEITHIYTLLGPLMPSDFEGPEFFTEEDQKNTPMFVMTNSERFYGAAGMLYTQELYDFSKKIDSDLYILPSSIHEVILIPAKDMDVDVLKNMVVEVNSTQVDEVEILSDSVYFYSKDCNRISRVA